VARARGESEEAAIRAPLVVGDPLQANVLTRKGLARVKKKLTMPLDLAFRAHGVNIEVGRVLDVRELARIVFKNSRSTMLP
jgi:hypothetical protein